MRTFLEYLSSGMDDQPPDPKQIINYSYIPKERKDELRTFPTLKDAQDYLNMKNHGHGKIIDEYGRTLQQCRCSGKGHETVRVFSLNLIDISHG